MAELASSANAWSVGNARLLGGAAGIAYSSPEVCRQWAERHGFPDFEFFSGGGTQGFMAQNPKTLLVAFRGTEPGQPADWITDARSGPKPWDKPASKVHQGFQEALQAVWPASGAASALAKRLASRGNRKVWITGHSLGGALAELCAVKAFFGAGVPVEGVYTFGQPRVGDNAYASQVHQTLGPRIFRFVNHRDIVPRVPLYGMGFRHYGRQVFFDQKGKGEDGPLGVEDLKGALQSARLALDLNLVDANLVRDGLEVLGGVLMDFFRRGNDQARLEDMRRQFEEALLKRARELLKSGTENVADHSMPDGYLPLFANG